MTSYRVATVGAAFSANKGAASMLQALVDNISRVTGPTRVEVLSTYPKADRLEAPPDVLIVSFTPHALLLIHFPLAVAAAVGSLLRLPRRWFCRTPALRSLFEADLVIDIAGISFVDGRGLTTLVYNTLMTCTPLLLGRRVIKLSQALGPFETRLNRWFAHQVLPRLDAICARGAVTAAHLDHLGLQNTHAAADLAFCMASHGLCEHTLDSGAASLVAVVPSEVVNGYCARAGINYINLMVQFIEEVCDHLDARVVLLPHAARPGRKASRMNDLPLCRSIHRSVPARHKCQFIDASLPPAELRSLISACDIVVTSRFHAMVSALATETPVVVVGWSHKYAEVLQPFELSGVTLDYADLSVENLVTLFRSTFERRDEIRSKISSKLPDVTYMAEENFRVIKSISVRHAQRSRAGYDAH